MDICKCYKHKKITLILRLILKNFNEVFKSLENNSPKSTQEKRQKQCNSMIRDETDSRINLHNSIHYVLQQPYLTFNSCEVKKHFLNSGACSFSMFLCGPSFLTVIIFVPTPVS